MFESPIRPKRIAIGATIIVAVGISCLGIARVQRFVVPAGGVSYKCNTGAACVEGDSSGKPDGVEGLSTHSNGLFGLTSSTTGSSGVAGEANGKSGTSYGVFGSSSNGPGVYGLEASYYGVEGVSTDADGVHGITSSTTGNSAVAGIAKGTTGSAYGVYGESSNGPSVYGNGKQDYGVEGISNSTDGIHGVTSSTTGNSAVAGIANGAGGSSYGVYGQSSNGPSIYGNGNQNYGVEGVSNNADGVHGVTNSANNGNAVSGVATNYGCCAYGVYGTTVSSGGAGVFGYMNTDATLGSGVEGDNAPVNGYNYLMNAGVTGIDSRATGSGVGVAGVTTADTGTAFYAATTDKGDLFYGEGPLGAAYCEMDHKADLYCTGTIQGGAALENRHRTSTGRRVVAYASESTTATIEDFGTARMVRGLASVQIEPTFASTIDRNSEYYVFLTPLGDTRGLYVSLKTPSGFQVHETEGGHSSLGFDYRIVAHPLDAANGRLLPAPPVKRPHIMHVRAARHGH